jgi:hypothetical protein
MPSVKYTDACVVGTYLIFQIVHWIVNKFLIYKNPGGFTGVIVKATFNGASSLAVK